MTNHAFRILTPREFEQFRATGIFEGSEKDRAAGFIHLSAFDQLSKRFSKYGGKSANLRILEIDLQKSNFEVKWELAEDGEEYPHLFGPILSSFATEAEPKHLQLA